MLEFTRQAQDFESEFLYEKSVIKLARSVACDVVFYARGGLHIADVVRFQSAVAPGQASGLTRCSDSSCCGVHGMLVSLTPGNKNVVL